jgi:hypothetical protein
MGTFFSVGLVDTQPDRIGLLACRLSVMKMF